MATSREQDIYKVTFVGTIVNLSLVIFKFVAGIIGRSAAMIADAVHSLSDFITDIIVILFIRISGKPADEDHDYGHGKYETLATTIIGLMLLAVGVGIFADGLSEIVEVIKGKVLESPRTIALVAAVVSIVSKEILFRYTIAKGKKLSSAAVVANAWHHRSDALSSVGVLVGVCGAMILGEKFRVLDPLAAVFVSVFIVKVAVDMLKPCLEELLEKSLPADVEHRIMEIILSVEGVRAPHHLRTRRIGSNYAIEVHIRMDGNIALTDAHNIATQVERRIKQEFGESTHVGIHMEPTK